VTTRTEEHVDFGTAARLLFPEQTLSSRWAGYYTPQDAGSYDIFVQTTREVGGSYRLYVDDKLVLDNWTTLTALADYRTLRFDPGPHKIVLEQHGRAFRRAVRLRMGIVRAGQFVSSNAKKLAASADVVVVAAGFDSESEAESADRTFRLPLGQDELIQEMAAANKNTIVVMTSGGSVDMNAWLDRVPALVQAWYPGQEGGTALAEILFGDVGPSGRLPVTFERRWGDNPVHDSYYPEAGTKRVVYREGVFVGYRGYEHNHTKPLFPFGFGLSYTMFEYSNLSITPVSNSESGPRYEVSFDVKNTGKVSVILDSRALSYYDVNAKQWRAEPGDFNVLVGRSSEQIELRGKLTLPTSPMGPGRVNIQ
jgi:beta-glucosidase